ncbi:MAG: TIGR03761 family integrating conjugative element protein [Burkholderiales bacterium]|nr:TIGR03761 family integrating conjugative element protein [Burkholderiales bacterium]
MATSQGTMPDAVLPASGAGSPPPAAADQAGVLVFRQGPDSPSPIDYDIAAQRDTPAAQAVSGDAKVGQLADATPDTMTLHTRDAFRMFTGRPADADAGLAPIPGARRFAAILNSIWRLSANDNPYADWLLVRMYAGLVAIRAHLSRAVARQQAAIDLLKGKGLALSVMVSQSPKLVDLGFRSPYGYATAEAIVEFDYYVRVIKTLIHKDRMSDQQGRAAIREVGREMRALFLGPIRWERQLLREDLRQLSRSDFLPGADELARARVRAAVALFGELPRSIFTGAEAPRHTRRSLKLTDAELQLLEQATLSAAVVAGQQDTELL